MDDVRSGELLVSRAAKVYGVPKSTLHDCVLGRVLHGHKPGPKPYLSVAEEKRVCKLFSGFSKSMVWQNKTAEY